MLEMFFLGVASKAVKIPYGGTCQPGLPLPLVELLLQGLFPQRNPQSSKICLMGKSPDTRESQRADILVSQQSKKHVLLSYHKAIGAVVSCSSRQQFSCRLALQATLADYIIGFKVAGHVENRAAFPVHCFPWDKRILHRSLQRNLSNEMPGPICSGRNHSPAFKKC